MNLADKNLKPEKLDGFDAVVIRSATKMNAEAISQSPSLKLIGRAGVGVDNIIWMLQRMRAS